MLFVRDGAVRLSKGPTDRLWRLALDPARSGCYPFRMPRIPPRYDPQVDRYSQELLETARALAKDPNLAPKERLAAIDTRAQALEARLEDDYHAGRIGREQFDGGPFKLGPGGELGELRQARAIAAKALSRPDAASALARKALLFTTDVFHNATLTGSTEDGRMVHVRFGTHGGLELRERALGADGFPFPGTKWVEGDLVLGDRIYSFVDSYTDNFKVDLDAAGRPVKLRFLGEVDVKRLCADVLTTGPEKWSGRRPPTEPIGRARVELEIPLSSAAAVEHAYGALGSGFFERNFSLRGLGGDVHVTPLDAGGRAGARETFRLGRSSGALEEGQFRNVPRALPMAYSFVQGQRIDTSRVIAGVLLDRPADLAPLFPEGTALRGELERVIAVGAPAAGLAGRLDRDLLARARLEPELRRAAAPILIGHLGAAALPEGDDVGTSTQFAARLLAEGFAARVVNVALGRAIDEAGVLSSAGVFTAYERGLDLLTKNPDYVDPVAVLNVNHVPLWHTTPKGLVESQLERRTDLLFDEKLGAFVLGFQEVFHASP